MATPRSNADGRRLSSRSSSSTSMASRCHPYDRARFEARPPRLRFGRRTSPAWPTASVCRSSPPPEGCDGRPRSPRAECRRRSSLPRLLTFDWKRVNNHVAHWQEGCSGSLRGHGRHRWADRFGQGTERYAQASFSTSTSTSPRRDDGSIKIEPKRRVQAGPRQLGHVPHADREPDQGCDGRASRRSSRSPASATRPHSGQDPAAVARLQPRHRLSRCRKASRSPVAEADGNRRLRHRRPACRTGRRRNPQVRVRRSPTRARA